MNIVQIYEKQISVKLFRGNNNCLNQQMFLKFPQYHFYSYLCHNSRIMNYCASMALDKTTNIKI